MRPARLVPPVNITTSPLDNFDKFHLPYTDLVIKNGLCGVLITGDHNKWTLERRMVKVQKWG